MHNQKTCAYHLCGKTIEQGKEVKNELTLIRGAQLTHEERDYCSVYTKNQSSPNGRYLWPGDLTSKKEDLTWNFSM
ncbi:hypothetical protein BXA16_15660 [Salmonella enterica subsp. enterica serovar Typhimurium]|nr:hypothetical protein BXA16_15660 [Salmonella enterica subsp. enterica serovar Typhimurium]